MNFKWQTIVEVMPLLLNGAKTTMIATIAALLLAIILGLLIAIARFKGNRSVVLILDVFVTVIRSTPLLIQLYLLFYVLPLYGPTFSPLVTGIFALGLHYSSFMSEVFRAGIQAIPRGQWDACVAVQLSQSQIWRRIMIPQVFRIVVPQIGNYAISMYKHAALLATITVVELLGAAMNYAGETFRYFEVFTMLGLVYFFIGATLSFGVQRLEQHYAK